MVRPFAPHPWVSLDLEFTGLVPPGYVTTPFGTHHVGIATIVVSDETGPRFVRTGRAPAALDQESIDAGIRFLFQCHAQGRVIVTWGGTSVDFRVLAENAGSPATRGLAALLAMLAVDPAAVIAATHGFMISLDRAAKLDKPPSREIPELWAAGRWREVLEHNKHDCDLTSRVYAGIFRSTTEPPGPAALNGWADAAHEAPDPDRAFPGDPWLEYVDADCTTQRAWLPPLRRCTHTTFRLPRVLELEFPAAFPGSPYFAKRKCFVEWIQKAQQPHGVPFPAIHPEPQQEGPRHRRRRAPGPRAPGPRTPGPRAPGPAPRAPGGQGAGGQGAGGQGASEVAGRVPRHGRPTSGEGPGTAPA